MQPNFVMFVKEKKDKIKKRVSYGKKKTNYQLVAQAYPGPKKQLIINFASSTAFIRLQLLHLPLRSLVC